MQLGILKERKNGEKRVAATPETVKAYKALGFDVVVETGAGLGAYYEDSAYTDAGATIGTDPASIAKNSKLLLTVNLPEGIIDELQFSTTLVGLLEPDRNISHLQAIAAKGATTLSMEYVPRISRAQSMDALSSQANLAGYRAVIQAVSISAKVLPMMMTAAGKILPARVLVVGAGVAGLQAIATAKRLGAIVSAYDVRPVAKEQVESLGGKFLMVEDEESRQAETAGGYAKEMSDAYKAKQAAMLTTALETTDILITTAQIPGRPAPLIITEDMLKRLPRGAAVVDIAASSGGNVAGTVAGQAVKKDGITIYGPDNLTSQMAQDASNLYARNLLSLVKLLAKKEDSGALTLQFEDEIFKAMLLTQNGKFVHPRFAEAPFTEGEKIQAPQPPKVSAPKAKAIPSSIKSVKRTARRSVKLETKPETEIKTGGWKEE